MSLRIPLLTGSSTLTAGRYVATYKASSLVMLALPELTSPKSFSIAGTEVIIEKTQKDLTNEKYLVFLNVPAPVGGTSEANIGFGAVTVALLAVLGVGLTVMALEKIERIIDSPAAQVGIIAGSVAVVALAVGGFLYYVKKLRSSKGKAA